jgi:beta-xylosidase
MAAKGGASGGEPGGSSSTGGSDAVGGSASAGGGSGGGASKGGSSAVGGTKATGGTSSVGGTSATCPTTYSNPVIWEDLPDVEILRVDDTFYYTASTFHNSPGAPVLRSYDLVNWEYIGHSVPVLDFDTSYDLANGKRSYVNGIWASSLVYRKSNKTFYWYGCMHNVGGGYMFTATSPTGPWTKHKTNFCYYDVGLLVDDDDKMYAVYGNNAISVAQVNPDTFTQVKAQKILDTPASVGGPLEGSHFLKKGTDYYVFSTQYANGEWVMKSTSGPFGPYELKSFAVKLPFAGSGAGASPHQGNVFNTQNGEWYYMGFNDAYPAGRIPVMAPVTWSTDGWPSVTLVGGKWGATYPFPKLPCGAGKVKSRYGRDDFSASSLEPWWEWNHNPDNTKWTVGGGLTLQTATVTTDPYAARNTLTRRMPGPTSTATIELDYKSMKDGDVAGLAAWRDTTSFIAVKRTGGTDKVVLVSNATLDSSWNTSSRGTDGASAAISGGKIWLRVKANIRTDSGGGTATFFYSTDGATFTQLGGAFTMKRDWTYFLGYRYAILNYATTALGGSVKVASFDLVTP